MKSGGYLSLKKPYSFLNHIFKLVLKPKLFRLADGHFKYIGFQSTPMIWPTVYPALNAKQFSKAAQPVTTVQSWARIGYSKSDVFYWIFFNFRGLSFGFIFSIYSSQRLTRGVTLKFGFTVSNFNEYFYFEILTNIVYRPIPWSRNECKKSIFFS